MLDEVLAMIPLARLLDALNALDELDERLVDLLLGSVIQTDEQAGVVACLPEDHLSIRLVVAEVE